MRPRLPDLNAANVAVSNECPYSTHDQIRRTRNPSVVRQGNRIEQKIGLLSPQGGLIRGQPDQTDGDLGGGPKPSPYVLWVPREKFVRIDTESLHG
jgi:hypothetical protein